MALDKAPAAKAAHFDIWGIDCCIFGAIILWLNFFQLGTKNVCKAYANNHEGGKNQKPITYIVVIMYTNPLKGSQHKLIV